jgi:glucan endo-1,3-beta-D-glucosidase
MRVPSFAAAALALASSATAIQQGFNYGATNNDYSCRKYEDFHAMFTRAKNLAQPGFTSARLYTSIQCGSANAPIEGKLRSSHLQSGRY